MPKIPRPRRTAEPTQVEQLDDAILEGAELLEQLPLELRAVPALLRAAAGPATEADLTGQQEALTAFNRHAGVSSPSRTRRLRRPVMLSTLLTTKIALAAAAASAATLGGAAAAAYAGALPAPAQNFAHHAIGAPAAGDTGTDELVTQPVSADVTGDDQGDEQGDDQTAAGATTDEATPTPTETPVGPDATGPAAFGLCRAYTASQAHGSKADQSVAFRNLATAAGGADNIATYCAGIPHPGSSDHPTGKPTDRPTHPTGKPDTHGTGKPDTHPTGKPTTLPAHPTGRPATLPAHPTGPHTH